MPPVSKTENTKETGASYMVTITRVCVTSSSGNYKYTEYRQRYKYPKCELQTPSIHHEYYV